jgi:hypothetical protein
MACCAMARPVTAEMEPMAAPAESDAMPMPATESDAMPTTTEMMPMAAPGVDAGNLPSLEGVAFLSWMTPRNPMANPGRPHFHNGVLLLPEESACKKYKVIHSQQELNKLYGD